MFFDFHFCSCLIAGMFGLLIALAERNSTENDATDESDDPVSHPAA